MDAPPAFQRISRLTPLAQVHARLDAMTRPVAAREVAPEQARGATLAADVTADRPYPPHAMALRDGWAVSADAVGDASPYAPASLSPPPRFLECGDALPPGTDAVLPPDAVAMRDGIAEAMAAAAPGDGVLAIGADAAFGVPMRRAGEQLRDVDIAVLRAAGICAVSVRAPRLRVVCASRLGNTEDIVGPLIARAIEAMGAIAILHPDESGPDALERALQSALGDNGADAVVTIGGTGEGRHDDSIRMLSRIGRVAVHGMALRPGESAALGAVGDRVVLMLPGRPDAALAVWLAVGRRLTARLTGATGAEAPCRATLARKVTSTIGLAEVVPVGMCEGGVEPLASGYFPWTALTRAAGWILVPAESEGYAAGSVVDVMALP